MEQLNKVLLRGIVGNIRVSDVSEKKLARISLATNYAYKQNGYPVIETTWHSIVVWEKPDYPLLDSITKGDPLYIEGRLRQQRYIDTNGHEHNVSEVIASKVERLDETLTMEM